MLANATNGQFAIEKLLRPEAFPHEVTELRLLETHISWIVLTGPYVYKIKKPIKFEFVDYSKLELRKRFCQLEIELNRRFAPEIYLSVVPIYQSDNQLHVGGIAEANTSDQAGEPIAYAVKMREFPQDAILAARLEHSELTSETIDLFGKYVAEFHESIESANPTIECVQVECIGKDAIENFSPFRDGALDEIRSSKLDKLEKWTVDQFEKLNSVFQKRLMAGLVRRCHGDMHLKNIIQVKGRVTAFDGIEFNEQLQWIDVLSEIAFPVMDFVARGRADFGWRLLNSYLEVTGDYGDLEVLRFYLVYRAMVRAKVTWLNPANHTAEFREKYSVGPNVIDELAGPWDKYLKTAMYFAFDLRPTISITHGFSGSGKSTAAMNTIEQSGGIRIRSDVERRRIANNFKTKDKYSSEMSNWVYIHLLELSRAAVQAGFPVVIDATFLKMARRTWFAKLANEQSIDFRIINCDAPFEELCQRLRKRGQGPSDATIDVLKMQMESYDPLATEELQFVRKMGK